MPVHFMFQAAAKRQPGQAEPEGAAPGIKQLGWEAVEASGNGSVVHADGKAMAAPFFQAEIVV